MTFHAKRIAASQEMKMTPEADVRVATYGRLTGTGASGRTRDGQADSWTMGPEPELFSGRPCDLSGCA